MKLKALLLTGLLLGLSNCSTTPLKTPGIYKIGTPYEINGTTYYPKEDYSYKEEGISSWYGPDFHAGKTANGETYDMYALTAAHRTLPLPSIVKVTNLENGKSLVLRVNDRGPFVKNRIIDVSKKAARILGFHRKGTTKVRVELMEKESKELKAYLLSKGRRGTNVSLSYEEPIYTPKDNKVEVEPMAPIVYGEDLPSKISATCPQGIYIQMASFSSPKNAETFANSLKEKGNVVLYKIKVKDKEFFRVRLGPFPSAEKAIPTLDKLKSEGFSSQLVQEFTY